MRILIVEDEALVALEVESILAMAGHQPIAVADDLESTLAALEAATPDLALVDIQLARGASGLDVAAALKARGIPTLFATGNCPEARRDDLAIGCLHKPFSDRTLTGAVEAVAAILRGAEPRQLPGSLRVY
jgi:DNA-binding response OmpR family regulator